MKLQRLLDLIAIWSLVSYSNGEVWRINVQRHFNVSKGSDLIIPCTFIYPSQYHTKDVEVYWKTKGQSECSKSDLDRGAFVFHPNGTCVHLNYRGRTKLIGDKTKGNCSLQIMNVIISEPYLYVRVSGKGINYSFKKESVYISVNGIPAVTYKSDVRISVVPTLESLTTPLTTGVDDNGHQTVYLAVCIPVAALLIIFVAGITFFFYKRSKRPQTITREESKCYVNFSRAASNPYKSEPSCKAEDVLPEQNVVDDPVYVNYQGPTQEVGRSLDHIDDIYENVDVQKKSHL